MRHKIPLGLLLICTVPAFAKTVTGEGTSRLVLCSQENYAKIPGLTEEAKELAALDAERQCYPHVADRQSEFSVTLGCHYGMYGRTDRIVVRASAQFACGLGDDSSNATDNSYCEMLCQKYGPNSPKCIFCEQW